MAYFYGPKELLDTDTFIGLLIIAASFYTASRLLSRSSTPPWVSWVLLPLAIGAAYAGGHIIRIEYINPDGPMIFPIGRIGIPLSVGLLLGALVLTWDQLYTFRPKA
ncbi:hypothetical protein [Corynebacterium argentoratense]|uniref:hypothetical protein n=1 Tax=Corynebacterium argentoratense TaxID=42817 RepID=UPI001F1A3657|nr:hypothetical protein [Corynebacterium argentoratense]MCF1766204.1 hypothetical protein [Corynebacterium argentoratense]